MALPAAYLRPVEAVDSSASAAEAARRMRDAHVGALLVLDLEGRAVGIVTDRDLALRIVGARLDPAATPVTACMSSPLLALHPSDSTTDAARRMRERLVRRLPILDAERRPLGIVTSDDLVRDLGRALGALALAPGQGRVNEARGEGGTDSVFGKE